MLLRTEPQLNKESAPRMDHQCFQLSKLGIIRMQIEVDMTVQIRSAQYTGRSTLMRKIHQHVVQDAVS